MNAAEKDLERRLDVLVDLLNQQATPRKVADRAEELVRLGCLASDALTQAWGERSLL